MNLVVALCVAAALLVSLATWRDLFSPAKFFLASFMLFYFGAWLQPRETELWLLVLLVALVGATTVALEARLRLPPLPRVAPLPPRKPPSLARWLWLLTLPALLAQAYLVDLFGGLAGYINVLGNRVLEFRGLGWVRTLTSMLLVVNLVYLAVGLVERRRAVWWLGYGLHLLLLVGIGLLSGSRSGVLTVFAMQLFLFHYLRRPLGAGRVSLVAALLIAGAGVLGVAREGLKVDDGQLSTGLQDGGARFQSGVFTYGIEPLEILLLTDTRELAFGSTFATVLTNPVPRGLWPEKPDSGGVVFTKLYTGDAWDGASNLTPSFLGEWIINFGWFAGAALFALAYVALMFVVVRAYAGLRHRLAAGRDRAAALATVGYVCVMWAVVALMVGEVTNVVLGLVLSQLLPLALIRWLLLPRRRRTVPGRLTPT